MVAPHDAPDWWCVDLGPRPAVTSRRTGPRASDDCDWELEGGTAVDLYLSLWNRTRRDGLDGAWRDRAAVTWS